MKPEIVDIPIVDLSKAHGSERLLKYRSKDQYKSDFSTKFIGRGLGSTAEYARLSKAAGVKVNPGEYSENDVVFISANGKRQGGVLPDFDEIEKVVQAGATVLTDGKINRPAPEGKNEYNTGEKLVAEFLRSKGYVEKEELMGMVSRWYPEGKEPKVIWKRGVTEKAQKKYVELTQGKLKPLTWSRASDNGYEVSTKGDKRFSALQAKLNDGRTIEEAYQLDIKGYRSQGNDWRLGKGKAPKIPMSKEQLYGQYKALWLRWSNENPALLQELGEKAKGKTLTDMFATTDINQARALSELVNERVYKLTVDKNQSNLEFDAAREKSLTAQKQSQNSTDQVVEKPLKILLSQADHAVIKVADPGRRVAEYKAVPISELNKHRFKIALFTGTKTECEVWAKAPQEKKVLVEQWAEKRKQLRVPLPSTNTAQLKNEIDQLATQIGIVPKPIGTMLERMPEPVQRVQSLTR